MTDKLLPCPFCGGEAKFLEDVWGNDEYCYVICVNDNCNANTGRCDTEDEAIAKWNNRPNNWHTCTPTEEGWYLIAFIGANKRIEYASAVWCYDEWDARCNVVAWQKITPYEGEEVNG